MQIGGATLSDGPSTGSTYAPKWLKLTRRGSVFAAYVSADARAWAPVHIPQNMVFPNRCM